MSILNHTAIPYDMAEDVQPGATPDSMFMAQQAALIASQAKRIAELESDLAWYGEQARLARLIHSGGDAGRHALTADGGSRARAILNRGEG